MRQTKVTEFVNLTEFVNETLEDTLDYYFPKGDSRRGEAMVLFAKAQVEIDKIKNSGDFFEGKREGLEQGKEEERMKWVKEIGRCWLTEHKDGYSEYNVPEKVFEKLRDGK